LSGAIDVIVVENEHGELSCSPFHVRFGILQLLRPSQKKVDFIINGKMTNLPMKLGDGGEAFFVFEASQNVDVPSDLITSPVLSAASSPSSSPPASPKKMDGLLQEPEFLDITQSSPEVNKLPEVSLGELTKSAPDLNRPNSSSTSPSREATLEKVYKLSKRLTKINIPTKINNNGDLFLDMDGYKSNEKNIHENDELIKDLIAEEFGDDVDVSRFIKDDGKGNIIFSTDDLQTPPTATSTAESTVDSGISDNEEETPVSTPSSTNYVKTLRLTSDQLKFLGLRPGENDVCFSVDKGKALINSKLFLWKHDIPIVISDIDGTITKSDALGHVLTMLGRDWTHPGVAKLFADIALNGYNVMYLTARSVGQADSTRSYLRAIEQDGERLPNGPVILSPDRMLAALKREVVLKKPEVFKMACLNDLKNLYGEHGSPFYAGFGNRITDALSYRSVGIPSSRIFTINPVGEVHMELLELAGYKSSYVFINELVDHFFPPVRSGVINDETYTDVNYWREPLPELSDLSEQNSEFDNESHANEHKEVSGSYDDSKEYNEDDDEDYEYDDDENEDDEEDDYSDVSDEASYEDDLDDDDDLDAELLESPHSARGILPTMAENSGLSLNHSPVNGIHTSNNFVKASDLMNQLHIESPTKRK
jgi:phosphatidate phosphatase LPIN